MPLDVQDDLELQAELRELRERVRKLEANTQAMSQAIPLLQVDGIEIGRDFFRGEQGFLQASGASNFPVLAFVPSLISDPTVLQASPNANPFSGLLVTSALTQQQLIPVANADSNNRVSIALNATTSGVGRIDLNAKAGGSGTSLSVVAGDYGEGWHGQLLFGDLNNDIILGLGNHTADPTTQADFDIWGRSDNAVAHIRLGGTTRTILTDGDSDWTDLTDGGETALHSHAGGGGALKTSGGGYFLIPAATTIAEGTEATSAATADTYGSWVEMIASTAAALYIVGFRATYNDFSATLDGAVLDIGTGAAASESSISEWPIQAHVDPGSDDGHIGIHVTFPFPIPVPISTRIACRVLDSLASAEPYDISLVCINQSDLEAI